jgi:hypothetical protein
MFIVQCTIVHIRSFSSTEGETRLRRGGGGPSTKGETCLQRGDSSTGGGYSSTEGRLVYRGRDSSKKGEYLLQFKSVKSCPIMYTIHWDSSTYYALKIGFRNHFKHVAQLLLIR